MEADFMVQQAQLRNSFVVLFFILLAGCNNTAIEAGKPMLKSSDRNLRNSNGLLFFKNRLYNGTTYTLYPDTKDTAETAGFSDGKESGFRKRYYPGGRLKEVREFDKGRKVGIYTAYWENGRKKLEYFFKEDEYEGTCREWNADGGLIKEMNYENGYEKGPQKMFYDNGKIRANYTIINGRRYGLLGTKSCINVSDSVFKN